MWYAERYGWTPEQVDALPWWLETQIPHLACLHDEVRAQLQAEAQKQG